MVNCSFARTTQITLGRQNPQVCNIGWVHTHKTSASFGIIPYMFRSQVISNSQSQIFILKVIHTDFRKFGAYIKF